MKQKKCIAGILLLGAVCAQANNYEVTSPDGRLAVKVEYVDGKQCIINKKKVADFRICHPLYFMFQSVFSADWLSVGIIGF